MHVRSSWLVLVSIAAAAAAGVQCSSGSDSTPPGAAPAAACAVDAQPSPAPSSTPDATVASPHARPVSLATRARRGRCCTRAAIGSENLLRRMQGNAFRAFVHPPEAMVAVAESQGLTPALRHQDWSRAWKWDVVGLVR